MLNIYTSILNKTIFIDLNSKTDLGPDSVFTEKSAFDFNKFNIWFVIPNFRIVNIDATSPKSRYLKKNDDCIGFKVIINNEYTGNKKYGNVIATSKRQILIVLSDKRLSSKYNYFIITSRYHA